MIPLRCYADAEAFLNGIVNYEKLLGSPIRYDTTGFDLQGFRRLLTDLGDPHLRYAVIHVAGTKGKGSTCAFLEAVLRAAGLKTGLYTSPHIFRYTERIRVEGVPIPDDRFCRLLTRLRALKPEEDAASFRTVFEFLTAAGFLYFAEEGVDVAIIETGLGGRLDSTNVFDSPGDGPLINVLTPIAFDHTAVLGNTIEQIAAEKAGILRPHATTVLAPQSPAWADRVRAVVEGKLASLSVSQYLDADRLVQRRQLPHSALAEISDSLAGPDESCRALVSDAGTSGRLSALFTFHDGRRLDEINSPLAGELSAIQELALCPSLPGTHQLDNLAAVLCAAVALNAAGIDSGRGSGAAGGIVPSIHSRYPITLAALKQGVSTTQWPGRFEILSSDPPIILDGAHCPLSANAAADTFFRLYGPNQEVILVAGFLRDKPAETICTSMTGRLRVARAIACTPPTPRARPAEETAVALQAAFHSPAEVIADPEEAVSRAVAVRRPGQAVLILGSMYLIGPATEAVKRACSSSP